MSESAYARAGVDTSRAERAVAGLVEVLRRIDPGHPSRAVLGSGHYANVLRIDDRTGIALSTDGVGTKVVVAEQLQRFDTVGIDCIAMNVNDVICVGAEPIAVLDYIAVEEADPDVVLTHDTGCVTTLDKSQFAAMAHGKNVGVPVMSEAQFAALAMGAHPYRVCQLHWHSADYRPLLEKMGIDWQAAWAEFQEDLKKLESGERKFSTWDDVG